MLGAGAVVASFFGDFALRVNGTTIERLQAGKARDLFQYLLINRGRVIRRERLFEVLWPGSEWSPTASSLKVAVHSVRQILRDTAETMPVSPVEIFSRNQGYLLQATDVWLDIEEFEVSMAAGRAAEARREHIVALDAYRQAADLYGGDFLAAQTADWIDEQRQCYRSYAIYALSRLRADALCRDDHSEVIEVCHRILSIDPYHEDTYQTLMMIHGRRRELGQVREWYRLCMHRLRTDLELAPNDHTQQVFARAMRGIALVARA